MIFSNIIIGGIILGDIIYKSSWMHEIAKINILFHVCEKLAEGELSNCTIYKTYSSKSFYILHGSMR